MQKKIGAGAILLLAVLSFTTKQFFPATGVRQAGIGEMADTLKEISDLLQGFRSFLSGITLVSETIGFGTILLIIAVIIFSAGFSAMGVPRGAPSFFTSLVTADALWILWKTSFNAGFPEYSAAFIKSNLIVLSPLILSAAAVRLFPPATRRLRSIARLLFHRKRDFGKQTLMSLRDEFTAGSAALDRSLVMDMLCTEERTPVTLSAETLKHIRGLKTTLSRIDTTEK